MNTPITQEPLRGVLPPMLTPFTEHGDIDEKAFISNIQAWNQNALTGFLVLGSNSETAYLTFEEKLSLIKLTVKHAAPGKMLLAGTGVESTRETIELTNRAGDLGIHAALVLTPHYYGDAMTDDVLIRYYTDIADQSNIPILIYNVPKFSHINVSLNVVTSLCRHPNIIGMKDSAMNLEQLRTFRDNVPKEFNVMAGNVGIWLAAMGFGIRAGVHASANCLPNECAAIQYHFDHGDLNEAQKLQERINPVNKAVTATYGIAGLKYATTLMGYKGGFPRKPLLPLGEKQQDDIKTILNEAGFLQSIKPRE